MAQPLHDWTVWFPDAAATGLLLARGRIEPSDTILLHAAPARISVEVTDEEGHRLAFGKNLERTQETPICRLRRQGEEIQREDIWPTEADLDTIVLLPGGEAGYLKQWWHADDRQSWRWQAEFFNSIEP